MRALTLNLVYHTNIYNNLQIYKTIPLFNSFSKKNLERHFLSSQSYEFTRINLAYSIDKKNFPEANVDKKNELGDLVTKCTYMYQLVLKIIKWFFVEKKKQENLQSKEKIICHFSKTWIES